MEQHAFNFSGKVGAVTGASRGIGEAIARGLADRGAHVIISSRKWEGCEQVARSIREKGGSARALPCHIGEMTQIEPFFEDIQNTEGRLDCLVNNAATNPFFGPITEIDLNAFQKTVDVNIRGTFFMSQLGAKLMGKNTGGAILNIASVLGVVPGDQQGVYSMTKAGVISMTRAFARECASMNIRVNALLPGATDTKLAAALVQNPDILKEALKHIPMKRVAEPEEMVAAALYLLSDAASYTTGSCLTLDGGYLTV